MRAPDDVWVLEMTIRSEIATDRRFPIIRPNNSLRNRGT